MIRFDGRAEPSAIQGKNTCNQEGYGRPKRESKKTTFSQLCNGRKDSSLKMWPRAFLDDPGAADDDGAGMNAAYGDGSHKSKRKGQAGIQVRFFELSRDGAKLRMEYRKRMKGETTTTTTAAGTTNNNNKQQM